MVPCEIFCGIQRPPSAAWSRVLGSPRRATSAPFTIQHIFSIPLPNFTVPVEIPGEQPSLQSTSSEAVAQASSGTSCHWLRAYCGAVKISEYAKSNSSRSVRFSRAANLCKNVFFYDKTCAYTTDSTDASVCTYGIDNKYVLLVLEQRQFFIQWY